MTRGRIWSLFRYPALVPYLVIDHWADYMHHMITPVVVIGSVIPPGSWQCVRTPVNHSSQDSTVNECLSFYNKDPQVRMERVRVRVPPAELNISAFSQSFWYVQPRLCDWAYKRSRATYQKEKGIVSRWSVSS